MWTSLVKGADLLSCEHLVLTISHLGSRCRSGAYDGDATTLRVYRHMLHKCWTYLWSTGQFIYNILVVIFFISNYISIRSCNYTFHHTT